jgi:predicted peroxiredoxin
VSICSILRSALLLKRGVAETLYAQEGSRPLNDFVRLALKAGVEFRVCDAALQMCDMTPDDLVLNF